MLSKLSERERETLLLFSEYGSGGAYDVRALNSLFTLRLLTIGDGRKIVMTDAGRAACDLIRASRKPNDGSSASDGHAGRPSHPKSRRSV